MSGSGKSRAASILEDIGYYIVDNLPAEMMVKFADFCAASRGHYDRVALVYDVRAGEPFDLLIATLLVDIHPFQWQARAVLAA